MPIRFRLVVVTLAAGLLLSGAARAGDEKSGLQWLRKCTNPEAYWQIECAIYVRALVEYDEARAKELGEKRFICAKEGVTIRQSREVVIKFLRENPQELHRPFALLAHRALEAAFPCSGARPQ